MVTAHLLKSIVWNGVQAHHWLVGLLDNDELAIIKIETHVNDGSYNPPAVIHVQVNLHCKVLGLAHLHHQ